MGKSILERFLMNKGLKTPDELDNTKNPDGSPTERETYENWRRILSRDDELTLDDVKVFLQGQIALIEARWKDMTLANERKAELIPYHTVYKTLDQVISSPRSEREQLEQQLNQMIL